MKLSKIRIESDVYVEMKSLENLAKPLWLPIQLLNYHQLEPNVG